MKLLIVEDEKKTLSNCSKTSERRRIYSRYVL